jgi:Flp pilus assembly pilin Flp
MKSLVRIKKNNEAGITLLEYCAGAAVLITLLYAGMVTMGGSVEGLFNAIGGWATDRAGEL